MLIIESQNGDRVREISDIRFGEKIKYMENGNNMMYYEVRGDGFLLGEYSDEDEFILVKALINEKIATVEFLKNCVVRFGPEALNPDSQLDLVDMFIFKMPMNGFSNKPEDPNKKDNDSQSDINVRYPGGVPRNSGRYPYYKIAKGDKE